MQQFVALGRGKITDGLLNLAGRTHLGKDTRRRSKLNLRSVQVFSYVDSKLAVDADRELLLSALGNLLQNAFKFTHPLTEITLKVFAVGDRILIEVEDKCGGLPGGDTKNMFLPFTQSAANRTGAGLGLSISRRSVEANQGLLTVRDVAGIGCVFTVDLPRHAMPERSLESLPAA